MHHEVWIPCKCSNVEACSTELYISDVRIARRQIDMQQRALQLIADVAQAFVTVAGLAQKKRRG